MRGGLGATIVAALALCAPAWGADTYVNDDGGSNGNDCTNVATPCFTVQAAVDQAGAGDTIHVDFGSYPDQVTLGSGKSLLGDNFNSGDVDPIAEAAIASGILSPVLQVLNANPAGTISGLSIRGPSSGVGLLLASAATVSGNLFNQGGGTDVEIIFAAAPTISGNTFTDTTPTDVQVGLVNNSSGSPLITGNSFAGLNDAVRINSGTPTVSGNQITGLHTASGTAEGVGIDVLGSGGPASALVVANRITDPGPSGGTNVIGIKAQFSGNSASVTSQRNLVLDHTINFRIIDTASASLDSDILAGGTGSNLDLTDTGGGGSADATAINLTAVGTGTNHVFTSDAVLTLDSSLIDQGGVQAVSGGACSISFSRGPVQMPGGDGCQNFQTTATPMFANPAGNDYHLLPGSPLLDAGNPAAPAAGSLDVDGQARAVDATPACSGDVARRDIGADELLPAPPNCAAAAAAPQTRIGKGPKKRTRKRKARFTFSSSQPGSTFQCRLTGKRVPKKLRSFRKCRSPRTYRKLKPGKKVFAVRAVSAAGKPDPTPAKRKWRVLKKRNSSS